jgi:hypothetical protein
MANQRFRDLFGRSRTPAEPAAEGGPLPADAEAWQPPAEAWTPAEIEAWQAQQAVQEQVAQQAWAAPGPQQWAAEDPAVADRALLVRTCMYVRDRVTSVALAERLDRGLAEAGVDLIDPTGERFDPSQHEAGGTQATDDPALVGTVAMVEVPGYADRGVVLRVPVVTVYQAGAATPDTDRTRSSS